MALVSRLLKIGAWIAIDDLNFNLRMVPGHRTAYDHYSDRELDTYQMAMVFDLIAKTHPDFTETCITHDGRIGWARKKASTIRGISSGQTFSLLGTRLKAKELTRKASAIVREDGFLTMSKRAWRYLLKDKSVDQ